MKQNRPRRLNFMPVTVGGSADKRAFVDTYKQIAAVIRIDRPCRPGIETDIQQADRYLRLRRSIYPQIGTGNHPSRAAIESG